MIYIYIYPLKLQLEGKKKKASTVHCSKLAMFNALFTPLAANYPRRRAAVKPRSHQKSTWNASIR